MALNIAQLMQAPGGAAITGAVQAGVNCRIENGTCSFFGGSPIEVTSVSSGSPEITVTPPGGTGDVTVSFTPPAIEFFLLNPGDDDWPAGTKMAFYQAEAPLGWLNDGTNNTTLRVVTGTTGGTLSGSLTFTNVHTTYTCTGVVTAQASVSGVTAVTDLTPSIAFSSAQSSSAASVAAPGGHSHTYSGWLTAAGGLTPYDSTEFGQANAAPSCQQASNQAGSNGGHGHSLSASGSLTNQGGGNHSHNVSYTTPVSAGLTDGGQLDFQVSYVSLILCTKQPY